MGDELVTVFVGRCPMGEQCSKKHGILTKKATEEEVRKAIHHHLRTSPYHEMGEEDAKGLVELSEIETWTEEAWGWQQGQTEEGDGWYQNRKKQKTRAMDDTAIQAAAWKLVQQQNPLQPHPPFHPPASSSTQLSVIGARAAPTDKIVLTRVQMEACVDSLKRAKVAAESACHLCSKASRAFGEEAACIQSCQEVLMSYLD